MDARRVTWKRSRISISFFIGILLVFCALSIGMVLPYLLAILMGSIIAVLTQPFYRRLRRMGLGPKFASSLVTLAVILLVVGPLFLFSFAAIKQAIAVGQSIADSGELSFPSILDKLNHWGPLRTLIDDPATMERQLRVGLQNAARTGSGMLLGVLGSVPQLLLQLALALMTCFFMLMDGNRFVSWLMEKLPLDPDVQSQLIQTFKNTSISTIWATLAAAGAQSALMFFAYMILGVPGAFLAGGATFIFAWIPVVGSVPVWVVGAIYLFTQVSLFKAILMVVFGLITGVVDNFVRPLVLKGRGEMHPLVALIAIFGGINWFGIMGVFIGPILASVLISLLEIWPTVAQRGNLIRGSESPPSSTA